MIDEEATFEKFGYHSYDLPPKTNKKIVVICDECGAVRIVQKANHSNFCPRCVQKGARCHSWKGGHVECICPICGKRIFITPAKLNRNGNNYCSRECAGLARKNGKIVKCIVCGKERYIINARIEKGQGIFCSRECYAKWQSKNIRGKNHPNYEGVTNICPVCGKIFSTCNSHFKKFCSNECRTKGSRGENSPNWQGGRSYEPYCERFNEEFKERIRDKFGRVCFICGKTEAANGRKLSVHHCNYKKDCLCSDDLTCQFVPLCTSCHAKTNSNRDNWQEEIMNKLRSRLDGYYI